MVWIDHMRILREEIATFFLIPVETAVPKAAAAVKISS
jgi:hypothetical protein